MKASKKYVVRDGKHAVELTVALAICKLRYIPTDPQRAEAQMARLQGPFGPKDEDLLDEATAPNSHWMILD